MKKKTKIIALVTAVIVLAGGIGGTMYYLKNRGVVVPDNPLIGDVDDIAFSAYNTMRYIPSEEENRLGLKLTNAFDNPAIHGGTMRYSMDKGYGISLLCENETGYYFTGDYMGVSKGDLNIINNAICYCDKETGTTIPLCPRPNCLHDGSLYCTATTEAYLNHDVMRMYGDYLYTTAIVDGKPMVLRYAPDGTEITEFAKFDVEKPFTDSVEFAVSPIIHRGYLFTVIEMQKVTDHSTPDEWIEPDVFGGFVVVACDLSNGSTTTIYRGLPPVDGDGKTMYFTPHVLNADGDYLYTIYGNETWNFENTADTHFSNDLNRISLLTGEVEAVDQHGTSCIANGYSFYEYYSKESAQINSVYMRDLYTKEVKTLLTAPEGMSSRVIADGKYIYVLLQKVHSTSGGMTIQIYDYDCNLVGETEFAEYEFEQTFAAKNGKLYVRVTRQTGGYDELGNANRDDGVYCAEVEAIVRGDAEWKKAFEAKIVTQEYLDKCVELNKIHHGN